MGDRASSHALGAFLRHKAGGSTFGLAGLADKAAVSLNDVTSDGSWELRLRDG